MVASDSEQARSACALQLHEEARLESTDPPSSTEDDKFLVDWEQDDPECPFNWSTRKKWVILGFYCLIEILASALSSVYSSGIKGIETEYSISQQVALLGQSLFVVGLAVAPLLLGPLSEYVGRHPVYSASLFLMAVFQIPAAYQHNAWTLIIVRFIAGCAASVPLTNTGGTVADLFPRDQAGRAVALFAFAGVAGPPFGPLMAGYIYVQKGWRWIFWVFLIILGALTLVQILFLPETKQSVLLERRAKCLRKKYRSDNFHTDQDKDTIVRAIPHLVGGASGMLVTEPIVLALALYNGYLYGLLYIFFEAYPLVFEKNHGWNTGEVGLAFLGIVAGAFVALLAHAFFERRYQRKLETDRGAQPEDRLEGALVGSVTIPIGLFWFAWTVKQEVNPLSPVLAGIPFGFGVFYVYYGVVNFVTDGYGASAASALAAISFVRSSIGAGLTHVADPTYMTLGYTWATAMLGFISLPMILIPWAIWNYGPALRKRSRHAPDPKK